MNRKIKSLPPFYVGQKVVVLKRLYVAKKKKGTIVEVLAIMRCKCGLWLIDIGTKCKHDFDITCECENVIDNGIMWLDARMFAPIQENFQSISLEKILEEETKLVGAN